jgi:hypothetical protein
MNVFGHHPGVGGVEVGSSGGREIFDDFNVLSNLQHPPKFPPDAGMGAGLGCEIGAKKNALEVGNLAANVIRNQVPNDNASLDLDASFSTYPFHHAVSTI